MFRTLAVLAAVTALVLGQLPTAAAGSPRGGRPGAPGLGDPYFPLDGNGGYDVEHEDLHLRYDPATDALTGLATITARATQDLSRFDLDLRDLQVASVEVGHHAARWRQDGGELVVTPSRALPDHRSFTTVVAYRGSPQPLDEAALGEVGFFPTDDGAVVAGQPHGAATWFPVNGHPRDAASYTFSITVPKGLQAVANGAPDGHRTHGRWTTWHWEARTPMASYLATMAIGHFHLTDRTQRGLRYVDAVDPRLSDPLARPRTGDRYALSRAGEPAYERLSRTLSVPGRGARLSFWVARATEPSVDSLLVEAHRPGTDAWTTLPDANGHTTQETGRSCPHRLDLHPFLRHYQGVGADGGCRPTGTTGAWWAASGSSDGYEQWAVDLSAYAGGDVEVAITYVTDDAVTLRGVDLDDLEVSTGEGSTSFEDDGDTLDGWSVPGAPEGSAPNGQDWVAGTPADEPPSPGKVARGSLAREPEVIGFLSGRFGPYPFSAAGGIVDSTEGLGFALETQTRPVYSPGFFTDAAAGDGVVVHELAHQWFGDSVRLARWQDIWLNEGFATYAEWLWGAHEGSASVQDAFDQVAGIPAGSGFWALSPGDPGPEHLFDQPVYSRGAMTLHALRQEVGDVAFFTVLRRWAASRAGHAVTTHQFEVLAERVCGKDLGALFRTWLYTPGKPAGLPEAPPGVP
jgi:Peptidase family M1 domain/Peptidase M1 N-terminal domain/Immune inhibitor A peptidase M6